MSAGRVRVEGWSFTPPEGYAVQQAPGGHGDGHRFPGTVVLSQDPVDRDGLPASLTLVAVVGHDASPLAYLRETETLLQRHFDELVVDFCEVDRVGPHDAARVQSSFVANLRLYRLVLAWVTTDGLLATATLVVPEPETDRGWVILRSFAESVRVEAPAG